ncbi:MAG TPA: extracellular solute-binding protein [Candidatus Acidoferrum sp.]|nr:extracellular solute-binding protein [Candidatus Acidoferrum sp.]
MAKMKDMTRRQFARAAGRTALLGAAATLFPAPFVKAADPMVINHWSWLSASDGEIWQKMIDSFNDAHKDKGVQIKMEVIPEEQYTTKILAAAATGNAPDFGWGTAGQHAQWAQDGVTVPLDDLAAKGGLDLADFSEFSLKMARFPKYDNKLFMIPMDLMSLQPVANLDHMKEAGLDPEKFPQDGDTLIEWAKAMTKREGDKVTRSGIMMTGSGVQPTVTWGIVAEQMGFQRTSDDLKTAAVNPDAGKAAMQWVLDLFDKHKVSTRDVTDRYKAFGTGQGSIFWTGPWALNGFMQQKLNCRTYLFPKIGQKQLTYFEMGGMEFYVQKDEGRYEATMQTVKWLSDNSFLWTTKGRGASPRKSILENKDYKTSGLSWDMRGAFVEGMAFATAGEIPVLAAPDFTIYSGSNFLAKTLEQVWAGQKKIDQAMSEIKEQWQKDLDAG